LNNSPQIEAATDGRPLTRYAANSHSNGAARRDLDGERESLETKDGEQESLETKDGERESLGTKDGERESLETKDGDQPGGTDFGPGVERSSGPCAIGK